MAAIEACPAVSAIARIAAPLDAPVDDPSYGGHRDAKAGPGEPRPAAITHDDHTVAVSVVAYYGVPLTAVVEQIQAALRTLIGDRELQVTITDLDTRRPRRGNSET